MNKMILIVPKGFDARTFCNIATAIVRDSQNETDRRDYDYDLGDYVQKHYVAGDKVYYFGENKYIEPISALISNSKKHASFEMYDVEASLVDFAHIEALKKLQVLCPEVEFHFENDGDGEEYRDIDEVSNVNEQIRYLVGGKHNG